MATDTMKALRWHAANDIRLEQISRPEPLPDEVLISVEWCGICGSDLHEYLHGPITCPQTPHPLAGGTTPAILGHEIAGRIKWTPPGSSFEVGQPVVVDPRFTCGQCAHCRAGGEHCCMTLGFLGYSGRGGGFAEEVPVKAKRVHAVTEEVLPYAALIEPLATAWKAVRISEIEPNETAFILGGGPIGVGVMYALRARGVQKVIVSEPSKKRSESLRNFTEFTLDPLNDNIAKQCLALTNGRGADVVFDCAGVPAALPGALSGLKWAGTYVNVALWDSTIPIPMMLWLIKETTLKTTLAYTDQDFKETLDAMIQGKFTGVEKMVTSRIALDEVKENGFDALVNNKDDHIKILIRPGA